MPCISSSACAARARAALCWSSRLAVPATSVSTPSEMPRSVSICTDTRSLVRVVASATPIIVSWKPRIRSARLVCSASRPSPVSPRRVCSVVLPSDSCSSTRPRSVRTRSCVLLRPETTRPVSVSRLATTERVDWAMVSRSRSCSPERLERARPPSLSTSSTADCAEPAMVSCSCSCIATSCSSVLRPSRSSSDVVLWLDCSTKSRSWSWATTSRCTAWPPSRSNIAAEVCVAARDRLAQLLLRADELLDRAAAGALEHFDRRLGRPQQCRCSICRAASSSATDCVLAPPTRAAPARSRLLDGGAEFRPHRRQPLDRAAARGRDRRGRTPRSPPATPLRSCSWLPTSRSSVSPLARSISTIEDSAARARRRRAASPGSR